MPADREPDSPDYYFKNRPETPFRREGPEVLLRRGFTFIGNRLVDESLKGKLYDDEYYRAWAQLKENGLRTEAHDITSTYTRSIKDYIRESLKDGYEIRLLRGVLQPDAKSMQPDQEHVAIFRRFKLEDFFTSKSLRQLQQEGFILKDKLPFLGWDKKIDRYKAQDRERAREKNLKIQEYIIAQEHQGNRVLLVRGNLFPDGDYEPDDDFVTIFIKPKPFIRRERPI